MHGHSAREADLMGIVEERVDLRRVQLPVLVQISLAHALGQCRMRGVCWGWMAGTGQAGGRREGKGRRCWGEDAGG